MKQLASVNYSGNSQVTVKVDTRAMAYAMMSCLYATGRFDDNEINDMMRTFEDMDTDKRVKFYKGKNKLGNAKVFSKKD